MYKFAFLMKDSTKTFVALSDFSLHYALFMILNINPNKRYSHNYVHVTILTAYVISLEMPQSRTAILRHYKKER